MKKTLSDAMLFHRHLRGWQCPRASCMAPRVAFRGPAPSPIGAAARAGVKRISLCCSAVAVSFLNVWLSADQVEMRNGDRYRGKVLSLDTNSLVFAQRCARDRAPAARQSGARHSWRKSGDECHARAVDDRQPTEYAGRRANQRCCQSFHATPATWCEHEFHKTNSSAVSRRRRARSEQQVQRNGRWPDEWQTDRERHPRGGEVSGGPTEGAQTRPWRRRQRSARWLPGHPRKLPSGNQAGRFRYKRRATFAQGQT